MTPLRPRIPAHRSRSRGRPGWSGSPPACSTGRQAGTTSTRSSTSACLHQPRNVSGRTPSCGPIRLHAALIETRAPAHGPPGPCAWPARGFSASTTPGVQPTHHRAVEHSWGLRARPATPDHYPRPHLSSTNALTRPPAGRGHTRPSSPCACSHRSTPRFSPGVCPRTAERGEQGVGQFEAGAPAAAVEQFGLHPAPEGLDDGVVVAVPDRAGLFQDRCFRPDTPGWVPAGWAL
jgi:hypothetical protein